MKKTLIACGLLAISSPAFSGGFSFSHFGYDNTTQYITDPKGTHVATLTKNASGAYLIDKNSGASTWVPQMNQGANPVTTNSAGANLSKNVELDLNKGVLKEAKKVNHSQGFQIDKAAVGRGLGRLARLAGPVGLGLALLDLLKDAKVEPDPQTGEFKKAEQVPVYQPNSFKDQNGNVTTFQSSPSAVCTTLQAIFPSFGPMNFIDEADTPLGGTPKQLIGKCKAQNNGYENGVVHHGPAQTQSQLTPITDQDMDTAIAGQITNPKMAPAIEQALAHEDVEFQLSGNEPAFFTAGPAVTTTPQTTSTTTTYDANGTSSTQQTTQSQTVMGTASGSTVNNSSITYNITNNYNTTTNGQLTSTTQEPAQEPTAGPTTEQPTSNDSLTGGTTCDAPPACSGSPIECYQANQLWKQTCAAQVPDKQQLEDKIDDGLETTVEGGLLEEKASINVADWITGAGMGGGCISDVQVFVHNVNRSVTIPLSHACTIVQLLRALFLIGTALHCLRVLTEALQ